VFGDVDRSEVAVGDTLRVLERLPRAGDWGHRIEAVSELLARTGATETGGRPVRGVARGSHRLDTGAVDPFSAVAVSRAYDAVAVDDARQFGDDLHRLPLDRALLDAAVDVAPSGWVLEAGCGPARRHGTSATASPRS